MSSIPHYLSTIQRADRIIGQRNTGLTHEDSLRQLPFPANCMNWNLGHLLVYREQYLGLLDGRSAPDPAEFALYGAGSEPITDGSRALPLATLLRRLAEVSARIQSALAEVTSDRLGAVIDPDQGTTVDDRLHFYLVFHESYHLGQLEILQELALAGQAAPGA